MPHPFTWELPPRAPPRIWLHAHFRHGIFVELRALSDMQGTCTARDRFVPLGVSASGASLQLAQQRLWARWRAFSASHQRDIIFNAVLEARDKGIL